ncbi:MAG: alpha/beta fold hydrolase [Burkholderiaceae bacterium]
MPTHHAQSFREGFLVVDGGHRIRFGEYGSPQGDPVVVLHGGPGSGCSPAMLDWFDLERDRVVLFDQRGAGASTPVGETAHNTTADLVADIERLRRHLGIGRWRVVGGSWGSTLAVCYAGSAPDAVAGLVLRGVFLGSRREVDWFFQSLRALAPEAWSTLTRGWNARQRAEVFQTLTAALHHGTPVQARAAAERWGRYEEAVMHARAGRAASSAPGPAPDVWLPKYRLQAHYLMHGCFTSERALFRHAQRAAGVPTIIVHGTHDWICPPENAVRLARFLPHAALRWVERGTHTASDPSIAAALRQAAADLRHTPEAVRA